MDFRQLESFVEIAKQESFTKAAETLYLAQPTLTGHIQALESELETVLFNRAGKKVTLTEAGQILFNHAINILNLREQSYYSLSQYHGNLQGDLAIAASTVLQNYFLPKVLAAFSEKYPLVTFELKQFNSEAVLEAILSGNVDFGFIGSSTSLPELEMCPIGRDQLILIAAPNISFKGTSLSLEQIKKENIIIRKEGSATRALFEQVARKQGLSLENLKIVAKIESPDTIKKCVRAGLGIAIISEQVVKEEIKLGLLKGYTIKDLDLTRNFYFITHKRRVLNPIARAFKDFIEEQFSLDF